MILSNKDINIRWYDFYQRKSQMDEVSMKVVEVIGRNIVSVLEVKLRGIWDNRQFYTRSGNTFFRIT